MAAVTWRIPVSASEAVATTWITLPVPTLNTAPAAGWVTAAWGRPASWAMVNVLTSVVPGAPAASWATAVSVSVAPSRVESFGIETGKVWLALVPLALNVCVEAACVPACVTSWTLVRARSSVALTEALKLAPT